MTFQDKLKEIYSKQDTIPRLIESEDGIGSEQSLQKYYVKLQIVLNEATEGSERAAAYDKVAGEKKAIEVADIFSKVDDDHPEVGKILLLGAAGVGKTTLLHYMSYCWGKGSWGCGNNNVWDNRFEYVFRVRLKRLLNENWSKNYTCEQKEGNLLACFIHRCLRLQISELESTKKIKKGEIKVSFQEVQDAVELPSVEENKNKVLLLLDGYDEISSFENDSSRSDEYNNIIGSIFEYPNVVMSSRPDGVSKKLQKDFKFERQVENEGLDFEGVSQLVKLHFRGTEKQEQSGKDLESFLLINNNILEMCKIPVNTALLCLIWSDEQVRNKLTSNVEGAQCNVGQLYREVIIWLGKRYSKKFDETFEKKKLAELSDEAILNSTILNILKDVAYTCFNRSEVVIGQEIFKTGELAIAGKIIDHIALEKQKDRDKKLTISDITRYGLLRAEGDVEQPLNQTYYFVHLTFQEYLSACLLKERLASSDKKVVREAASLIANHRNEPKYLMTLKFLSGLVTSETGKNGQDLVTRFWESVTCNLDGILELGRESKVVLFMHLLTQSNVKGELDQRIPYLNKIKSLIDEVVIKDIAIWREQIILSRYVSDNIGDTLLSIIKDITDSLTEYIRSNAQLSVALEIVTSLINCDKFNRNKEAIFEQLLKLVQTQDWQRQKIGLSTIPKLLNQTINEDLLLKCAKIIMPLIKDKNLYSDASSAFAEVIKVSKQDQATLLKDLIILFQRTEYIIYPGYHAENEPFPLYKRLVRSLEVVMKVLSVNHTIEFFESLAVDESIDEKIHDLMYLSLPKVTKEWPIEHAQEFLIRSFSQYNNSRKYDNFYDIFYCVKIEVIKNLVEAIRINPQAADQTQVLVQFFLSDSYYLVRGAAVNVIPKVVQSASHALELLKPALADNKTYRDATRSLTEIVNKQTTDQAIELLKPLLLDPEDFTKEATIRCLAEVVKAHPTVAEQVIELLKSSIDFLASCSIVKDALIENLIQVMQAEPSAAGHSLNLLKLFLPAVNDVSIIFMIPKLINVVEAQPSLTQQVIPLFAAPLSHNNDNVVARATSSLAEIVELQHSVAEQVMELLQPLLCNTNVMVVVSSIKRIINVVPRLAKKALNIILSTVPESQKHCLGLDLVEITEYAPHFADQVFKILKTSMYTASEYRQGDLIKSLAAITKVAPHLADKVFDILTPLLSHTSTEYIRSVVAECLAYVVKAEPKMADKTFELLKTIVLAPNYPVKKDTISGLIEIVKAVPTFVDELLNLFSTILSDPNKNNREPKIFDNNSYINFHSVLSLDHGTSFKNPIAKALPKLVNISTKNIADRALEFLESLVSDPDVFVVNSAIKSLPQVATVNKLVAEKALKLLFPLLSEYGLFSKRHEHLPNDVYEYLIQTVVTNIERVVKAEPQLAEHTLELLKTNLYSPFVVEYAKQAVLKTITEVIRVTPFDKYSELLNEENIEMRLASQKGVLEALKDSAKRNKVDFKQAINLLKIVFTTENSKENIEKELNATVKKTLKQLANTIEEIGIKWLNDHFSELPNFIGTSSFLKDVYHKVLSNGDINEIDSKLIIKCIVEYGLTTTIIPKDSKIKFENSLYTLANSQQQLIQIVEMVLRNSKDLLAQQYRKHEPLFPNNSLAIPLASTDISQAFSIVDISKVLENDSWHGSILHLSDHKKSPPSKVFVLLERRNYFGEHIIKKIALNENGEVLEETYQCNPHEVDCLRLKIFGEMKYTDLTKPRYYASILKLSQEEDEQLITQAYSNSTGIVEKDEKYYATIRNALEKDWDEYKNRIDIKELKKKDVLCKTKEEITLNETEELTVKTNLLEAETTKLKKKIADIEKQLVNVYSEFSKMLVNHVKVLEEYLAKQSSLTDEDKTNIKEYYETFVGAMAAEYTTAQIVDSDKVELNKSLMVKLLSFGFSFLPLAGGVAGKLIEEAALKGVDTITKLIPDIISCASNIGEKTVNEIGDTKRHPTIKEWAKCIKQLATDACELSQKVSEVAIKIVEDKKKCNQITKITREYLNKKPDKYLEKVKKSFKDLGEQYEEYVNGKLNSSAAGLLGKQDAKALIKEYLKYGTTQNSDDAFKSAVQAVITNCGIESIIDEKLRKFAASNPKFKCCNKFFDKLLSKDYIEAQLKKLEIGKISYERIDNVKIVMFKIMLKAVATSKKKNVCCVAGFIKDHPNLIEQIVAKYPEYDKLRKSLNNSELREALLNVYPSFGPVTEEESQIENALRTECGKKNIAKKLFVRAVKGEWNFTIRHKHKSCSELFSTEYISTKLKSLQLSETPAVKPEQIEDAQIVIIGRICKAIAEAKDFSFETQCLTSIANNYQSLVEKVADKHPEFFCTKEIAEKLIGNPELLQRVKTKICNFSGNGYGEHQENNCWHEYWYEYSKEAIDQLLKLRLESAEIKDATIISPTYVFDESSKLYFARDFGLKISSVLSNDKKTNNTKLLIPINLYNKHWVGVMIESGLDQVIARYMDSEEEHILKTLKSSIENELVKLRPNIHIEVIEQPVANQKYNNCGPEVIENLVASCGIPRIDDDAVLLAHSLLLEQSLLGENMELFNID